MSTSKSKANEPNLRRAPTHGLPAKETVGKSSPPQNAASREIARENTELPSGWVRTKFGSICKVQGGFAFKSMEYEKTGIPLVRISNLVDGQVSFESDTVYLPQSKLATHRNFILNKGDTLIAMSGATTGKMANFELDIPALLNQRVGRFRIGSQSVCAPRFISLLVQQITKKVLKKAYGAAQPNISPAQIEQMEIPLPPLDEQHGIVAEIEKQFTRLDSGTASLKQVQTALKRYRASVLKAACEGRLVHTEAELARREGRAYEPATELLARMFEDRRTASQAAQRFKLQAAGRQFTRKKGQAKFEEALSSNVPHQRSDPLPEGWIWTTVKQLGETTTGFTPPKNDPTLFGGNIPFFKPTDLDAGYNVRQFRDSLSLKGAEYCRCLPELSILVTCIGATIGKTGLSRVRCATNQQINALTVDAKHISPQFLFWFFTGPQGQRQIIGNSSATTLPILNKTRFEQLIISLPPLAEQRRIVVEVERRLSVIDELETAVTANLKRSDRLRQSILHRAFTGNL